MLDIKFIRENPDKVRHAIEVKKIKLNFDELIALDKKRMGLIHAVEDLRKKRNEIAERAQTGTESKEKLRLEGKDVKLRLWDLEKEFETIETEWHAMMLRVPNIPSDDTPIGPDETHNVEIIRWGQQPKFDFTPKDHIELGTSLDLLELERGRKVAGYRGYYLKNELALLHMALLWYVFKKMSDIGFTVMCTPTMVKEMALVGSGHFPDGREEIYEVEDKTPPNRSGASTGHPSATDPFVRGGKNKFPLLTKEGQGVVKEKKYLVGTSEPSLLAYYAGEVIDESKLPMKFSGLSQCYRREVGGYGKDTRGIYRVHEFMKVEQVVLCKDNLQEALVLFEEIKENALEILRELELPHRVIQVCTGDMGAGKYKMYDIETWMPSRNAYGETHSNSLLNDWQTRRINLRYRTTDGQIRYPFAMNNTAIASPRVLIAILENYQQADGSVMIPKVLRPYLNNKEIIGIQ